METEKPEEIKIEEIANTPKSKKETVSQRTKRRKKEFLSNPKVFK